MKKILRVNMKYIIKTLILSIGFNIFISGGLNCVKLLPPSNRIEKFYEIATQYNDQLPELWNNLRPEERIFAYYMYRASIPGNRIQTDQTHRDAVEMQDIFEKIVLNKEIIRKNCAKLFDVEKFLQQAELFLVYLFANQGQYFLKEFENHKRTPEKLKLDLITEENLVYALEVLEEHNAKKDVNRLQKSIFKTDYEPTVTVEGSIDKSAANYYSPDFTDADYDLLSPAQKTSINAYFEIEEVNSKRVPKVTHYKIGGKYSQELEIARFWLSKACNHAKNYPNVFDKNIPASLEYMINFLETGDEQDFKKFSIAWLKTNSKIDFNFGFIEVYQDPKQYRGAFEADITIKTTDMQKLNNLFPTLEEQLPFEDEFKRDNLHDLSAIPNASNNAKIFASGQAGPVKWTAAYCLPNYDEIRSQYGSKQIMYQMGKGLGELVNPKLYRKLFNIKEHADWLDIYDPEGKLDHDIWDAHVVLHETLGHGSGRLSQHVFVEGDKLTISEKNYKIGDSVQVTSDNINEFIGEYLSGLEELRAEILALYTSIFNFDELAAIGLFKDWPKKLSKEKLIERFIIHMAEHGISRLIAQEDDAKEIKQAHARADTTILNYLLDHGDLKLIEEKVQVDDKIHTVVGVRVTNLQNAINAVKDLAIKVQQIKSTGDTQGVTKLMKTYGVCVRNPEYIKTLKANRQAVQGDLKEIAEIFPILSPVKDNNGNIIDISAAWPEGFLDGQLKLRKIYKSKE